MTTRDHDISDDVAVLRSSLNLVDHAVASALGRVRALAEPAVAHGGRRWLVACSGGADSLVLLTTLALLRRRLDVDLIAAHVDHGLRAGSADEGDVVRRVAAALDVRFRGLAVSLAPGAGLAARARDARHAALDRCADELGADLVALGHTATDRAETLLLNLARGAGLSGLSAMPSLDPRRVRPLLDFSRAEIRALAERMRLPFVDDPTNDREDLPRTAMRHRVLPVLETVHGGADRRIAATAAELAEVREALDVWVARELASRAAYATVGDTTGSLAEGEGVDVSSGRVAHAHSSLQLTSWGALPKAVRLRTLRAFLVAAGVDGAWLGRDVVVSIDAACPSGTPAAPAAGATTVTPGDGGGGPRARASTALGVIGASWSMRPHRRAFVRQGTLVVVEEAASGPS